MKPSEKRAKIREFLGRFPGKTTVEIYTFFEWKPSSMYWVIADMKRTRVIQTDSKGRHSLPPGVDTLASLFRIRRLRGKLASFKISQYQREQLDPVISGYGFYGILLHDPAEDEVQCHVCGGWFKSLGNHSWSAHGLDADEYRKEFQLVATPLCNMEKSEKLSESKLALFRNPERREIQMGYLKKAHDACTPEQYHKKKKYYREPIVTELQSETVFNRFRDHNIEIRTRLLALYGEHPEMPFYEAAKMLGKGKKSVGRHLRIMEKAGLLSLRVERKQSGGSKGWHVHVDIFSDDVEASLSTTI